MVDLSVITISHGHKDEVMRLYGSIFQRDWTVGLEFLLIDNLPPHRTAGVVQKVYPDVRIIKNSRPHGFAYNANIGIRKTGGEFILLLNPDIIVLDGLFDRVVDFMRKHPEVGISGPMLLNPDGTRQPSARSFPSIPVMILRGLGLDSFFGNTSINSKYELRHMESLNGFVKVDWITGAAMVIRRRAIEEVGLLDHKNFHLYFEDVDICYRMWKAGWEVAYIPDVKAIHEWKRRSAKHPFSIYKYYHVVSGLRFFKKYGLKLKNPREGKT